MPFGTLNNIKFPPDIKSVFIDFETFYSNTCTPGFQAGSEKTGFQGKIAPDDLLTKASFVLDREPNLSKLPQ